MDDAIYTFVQDVREKRQASYGAKHRVNGAHGKSCTLPSDRLTAKEREALNGEVMTYNPNEFYTWDEFEKLPEERQKQYIFGLMRRYNTGYCSVGGALFGEYSRLQTLARKRGWLTELPKQDPCKPNGSKALKCAVMEKRSKDINLPSQAEKTAQNAPQSAETAKEAQASSEETPKSENKGILSKASFEFSEFDLDALKMVGAMFHGVKCKVRIEVETDG